ncbi:MAG TPA: hypothetical protein VM536_03670, partial [Chloroflexia bacterium]|nr:hypothetical protein [Chloroflexia bacterium]
RVIVRPRRAPWRASETGQQLVHARIARVLTALAQEQVRWVIPAGSPLADAPAGRVRLRVAAGAQPRLRCALGRLGFLRVPVDRGAGAGFVAYDAPTAGWVTLRVRPADPGRGRGHWADRVRRAARRLRARGSLLPRRGLSVALLGPDGAGKSTLAAGITGTFYFPVEQIYMGLWQGPPAPAGRGYVPGREIATRLRRAWGPYLRGRYQQARGRLVLFDRYTYDALVAVEPDAGWRSRLYYGVLGHACPAPDLVLVLDVPGTVMYARKGEHSVASLERQRQRYLGIAAGIRRAVVVDAARPAAAVQADAVARIWQAYVAQWSKKRQCR